VVASASGPLSENLIEQAVATTVQRTHQRELHWFSDGWHGYGSILERAYRQRVVTGKRGRPRLVVPETLTLTQTVKDQATAQKLIMFSPLNLAAGIEPSADPVLLARPPAYGVSFSQRIQ